jgi:hypothetical protein
MTKIPNTPNEIRSLDDGELLQLLRMHFKFPVLDMLQAEARRRNLWMSQETIDD